MIEQISEKLKTSQNILIVSHKNPDGDTIGSNFALNYSLTKAGKNVMSYCDSNIPFEFQFLLKDEINFTTKIDRLEKRKFDVTVFVDCGDIGRTEHNELIKNNSDFIINIDHHKTNTFFGDINLVDIKASATAEIIYEILINGNFIIDTTIAEALYTAILTDTGSFRYSNTTEKTFKIAAQLLKYNLNCWDIAEKVYENKPLKRIYILREALNNLKISKTGKVAILFLDYKTMSKHNASAEDTDGIVNIGRSIHGVEISIFIREEKNGCKLSFRSRGNLDVSEIAQNLGGGGHKNAAGAFLDEPLNVVFDKILKILENHGL